MSRGTPWIQVWKVGTAGMLLSRMARAARSLTGKKVSMSKTPSFSKGGLWVCRMRSARVRSRPCRQACWKMLLSRMCSRDCTGSISSKPTKVSKAVTVPLIFSNSSCWLPSQGMSGALREARMEMGMLASEPGV